MVYKLTNSLNTLFHYRKKKKMELTDPIKQFKNKKKNVVL